MEVLEKNRPRASAGARISVAQPTASVEEIPASSAAVSQARYLCFKICSAIILRGGLIFGPYQTQAWAVLAARFYFSHALTHVCKQI